LTSGEELHGAFTHLTGRIPRAARSFGEACLKYYCEMLPNDEEVIVVE